MTDLRTLHDLCIESRVNQYLASDPAQIGLVQKEALVRLALVSASGPQAHEGLRHAVTHGLRTEDGISKLWIDPAFISPLIATAAYQMRQRLYRGRFANPRPVLMRSHAKGVFGFVLLRIEDESVTRSTEREWIFGLTTARATLRAICDHRLFVMEVMADVDVLLGHDDA